MDQLGERREMFRIEAFRINIRHRKFKTQQRSAVGYCTIHMTGANQYQSGAQAMNADVN